jgi:hypothetical protein
LVPVDFFFVPEVEINSERSPISDNRRDRRKFVYGPSRYPTKRVPELKKKKWKMCIDSGGEYFEGESLIKL